MKTVHENYVCENCDVFLKPKKKTENKGRLKNLKQKWIYGLWHLIYNKQFFFPCLCWKTLPVCLPDSQPTIEKTSQNRPHKIQPTTDEEDGLMQSWRNTTTTRRKFYTKHKRTKRKIQNSNFYLIKSTNIKVMFK